MRQFLLTCAAVGLLLGFTASAPAQDDTKTIIEKAIKAHGGAERLEKDKASKTKGKGTLVIANMEIPFTSEATSQLPDKFKEHTELDIMGQKIQIIVVYDGTKGWVSANGMTMDLDEKKTAELKEAVHLMRVSQLTNLRDKKYQLSPLGEVKVNDKAAVGVKVSAKGFRDVSLYFYKDSGLTAKVERRALDPMTEQEANEERMTLEYQDVDGRKSPKKMVVNRDGKKYLEVETTEVKYLDKIDDSEFSKP